MIRQMVSARSTICSSFDVAGGACAGVSGAATFHLGTMAYFQYPYVTNRQISSSWTGCSEVHDVEVGVFVHADNADLDIYAVAEANFGWLGNSRVSKNYPISLSWSVSRSYWWARCYAITVQPPSPPPPAATCSGTLDLYGTSGSFSDGSSSSSNYANSCKCPLFGSLRPNCRILIHPAAVEHLHE